MEFRIKDYLPVFKFYCHCSFSTLLAIFFTMTGEVERVLAKVLFLSIVRGRLRQEAKLLRWLSFSLGIAFLMWDDQTSIFKYIIPFILQYSSCNYITDSRSYDWGIASIELTLANRYYQTAQLFLKICQFDTTVWFVHLRCWLTRIRTEV